jgi:hypothetical protein
MCHVISKVRYFYTEEKRFFTVAYRITAHSAFFSEAYEVVIRILGLIFGEGFFNGICIL